MRSVLREWIRDDRGQDLIEYAFLGAAVALAAIVGAEAMGTALNNWYISTSGAAQQGGSAVTKVSF